MQRILFLLAITLLPLSIFAQVPQKMSYQAVIRNSTNALVASKAVGMRVSILQGSTTGTEVYKEITTPILKLTPTGWSLLQLAEAFRLPEPLLVSTGQMDLISLKLKPILTEEPTTQLWAHLNC